MIYIGSKWYFLMHLIILPFVIKQQDHLSFYVVLFVTEEYQLVLLFNVVSLILILKTINLIFLSKRNWWAGYGLGWPSPSHSVVHATVEGWRERTEKRERGGQLRDRKIRSGRGRRVEIIINLEKNIYII